MNKDRDQNQQDRGAEARPRRKPAQPDSSGPAADPQPRRDRQRGPSGEDGSGSGSPPAAAPAPASTHGPDELRRGEAATSPAPDNRPLRQPARPHRARHGTAAASRTAAPGREAAATAKPRKTGTAGRPPAAAEPRAAALLLLAGVREGASLDDQIAAGALDPLPPEGRARAQRLAAVTLRHLGRAEAALAPLLDRRPRPGVGDLLRLATVEMLALGGAPHGVVSAAVTLAKAQGQKGAAAAGMVNAVLRRVASPEAAARWAAAGPARLPEWLRQPVAHDWGETTATAIEAAHEAGAPVDLTLKPGAALPDLPGARALPTGTLRLPAVTRQISALPGFAAGDWWVQDTAAALPARLLDPQPGERIADLCAAPGGKTLQLAAAGARVTAVELAPARARRLAENLTRCALPADLVIADARDWQPETPPDAILLDAPCSATGTIRRHPELPLIRDGVGLEALIALQAALLDRAIALLPPGGRMVYATCSLLRAEGEDQIAAALSRHPGLSVTQPDAARLGIDPGWITTEGGLRLRPDFWPESGGMDGFYMARLQKSADTA